MHKISTFFVACMLSINPITVQTQTVQTPLGTIQGTTVCYNGIQVQAYLGIPYAEPPTGNLRFRRTVPLDDHDGTIMADRFGPACLQYTSNPFPWRDDNPGHREDCLTLNVWVRGESEGKVVLFFIHGGGYRIGSGRLDSYDGRVLAKEEDLVVVTFNYRLGPMGFLYSGSEDAPGNMGLYDILEALKWVRAHIHLFGGDRDRITLFGHSSGAITAGMFAASPLASGLFQRMVLCSGSPANLDAEDNGRDFRLSQALAEAVGCAAGNKTTLDRNPEKVMDCMRDVDGMTLIKTISQVSDNPERDLYPRFGDEILPSNARQALIDGHFKDKEVMVGTTSGEGSTMVTKTMVDVFGFFGEKDPKINKTFGEEIIRKHFKNFKGRDAVVEHYLGDLSEDDYDEIRFQVTLAFADHGRICPSVYLAESFAKRGSGVYFYFFTHRSVAAPWAPWMLAPHFEDIPYFFGVPLRRKGRFSEEEASLSRRMMRFLATFAKEGYPVGSKWPAYSQDLRIFKTIDVNRTALKIGPHLGNCNFFRPYFGF